MKFSVPPNKNYRRDIEIMYSAISSGHNITFSKYCDGEMSVIENTSINNKEFWFDSKSMIDNVKREKLLESIKFQHPQYFVGIMCPKVFGIDSHRKMKEISGQSEEHLTWADIFVNSNYKFFVENIVPLFSERPVVLFCNKNGKTDNLPFKPVMIFPVENNAWEENWSLIQDAKTIFNDPKWVNCIVLFCCGPFGNILAYELTKVNPNNTYLDIGSTLNPWLQSAGFERHYYMGDNFFSRLTGEWDQ
jgi:hypothetical protein